MLDQPVVPRVLGRRASDQYPTMTPAQILGLLIDKGFSVAVAAFLLWRMEATVGSLRDATLQNGYQIERLIDTINRLPH